MMNFKTVKINDLYEIISGLARQIRDSGFSPKQILYLEKAGRVPGYMLRKQLGGTIEGITVARQSGKLKSQFGFLLPYIPYTIRKKMRKVELGFYQSQTKRDVTVNHKIDKNLSPILILDDAVDSGYSVLAVINYLQSMNISRNDIRVAVLNTTGVNRVIEPDYVHYPDTIIIYPWSLDSIEHKLYLELYEKVPNDESVLDFLFKWIEPALR